MFTYCRIHNFEMSAQNSYFHDCQMLVLNKWDHSLTEELCMSYISVLLNSSSEDPFNSSLTEKCNPTSFVCSTLCALWSEASPRSVLQLASHCLRGILTASRTCHDRCNTLPACCMKTGFTLLPLPLSALCLRWVWLLHGRVMFGATHSLLAVWRLDFFPLSHMLIFT